MRVRTEFWHKRASRSVDSSVHWQTEERRQRQRRRQSVGGAGAKVGDSVRNSRRMQESFQMVPPHLASCVLAVCDGVADDVLKKHL